ncbi:unnamed protein product [Callosobruchus maculatus]|uniref:Saposin B-type domain-containing protein n=1 Tax=Callosobruchus maculatus TaxID=64391 RepID=A0A653CZH5_CALMS|nr:unnamed protein product [Callosobruchus maculatus]
MMNPVYAIVLLSVLGFSQAEKKLKVSLYYESLCGGCTDFIRTQLHPVYSQFADYLELDIVPFGNAQYEKVGKKWIFKCQHGPQECYGNVIHACALASNPLKTALDFIYCSEGQADRVSDETFQKCATEVGIKFEDLKHCTETEGDSLIVANAKKSAKVGYSWVPFVTFNDEYDEDVSKEAQEDLKGLVCKYFADKPPKGCPSPKVVPSVCRA